MPSLTSYASRYVNPQPLYGMRPSLMLTTTHRDTTEATDLYRILRAYYYNNNLYDALADYLRRSETWKEALKPFRNPAFRTVEFYPASLWPGALPDALPIKSENAALEEPIQQIWKWSNWSAHKQVVARDLALYGDMFLKAAATDNQQRVYLQRIEPEYVTDFDTDERGFIQWCRIDVPLSRRHRDGMQEWYWHTEVWDTPNNLYRVWEQQHNPTTPTEQLGTPKVTQTIASFGIDFVPIVHAKFADMGEKRGMSSLMPALDKIDEANRQATRLSQMLFRHNAVTWALKANSMDASGRPLPAPRLPGEDEQGAQESTTVTLGDDRMLKLPGMSDIVPLVPQIDYGSALATLQDHMREVEQDLPELVAYRMMQNTDLSGRAVRLMLGPAIKRLEEARGNAEAALVRAHQMALTIGGNLGLFGNLGGDFDSGAFEHGFEERDILPTDDLESAQTAQANATALSAMVAAGVPVEIGMMEIYGWTEEQAATFTQQRTEAIKREQALVQDDQPEEDAGGPPRQ